MKFISLSRLLLLSMSYKSSYFIFNWYILALNYVNFHLRNYYGHSLHEHVFLRSPNETLCLNPMKTLIHKCWKYDIVLHQGYNLITWGSNFKYSYIFFYGYLSLLKIPSQLLRWFFIFFKLHESKFIFVNDKD